MDDIKGVMKYSAVNTYEKYYSRRKNRKRKSATKPLDNVITNDGVNQQDGKQNFVHALVNVKQPSPMVMFNCSSKPIWSGIFKTNSKACPEVDAHLSTIACKKVVECSKSLQPVLEIVKLPRLRVWPKGWESSGPRDVCIGLYFFPSNSRSIEVLDELVNEVIKTESAIKVTAATADLLIFPSVLLPEQNQLYQGKHYLWGLFRRRKDISDEVELSQAGRVTFNGSTCASAVAANDVPSVSVPRYPLRSNSQSSLLLYSPLRSPKRQHRNSREQKGSACAMPVDERGQQAHLLTQVDEAQLASSQQITFAMNDSHDENPPLVESTWEPQIDESMELEIVVLGGEQNGSACAMLMDEGGQQAHHLLNQVDEAQTASSEQMICATYDSHVENPLLVGCPREAQINEAMETITGECLMTLPGSSFSVTKQPNSPKAVSNCSAHHPEEVNQPGDTLASSSFSKACIGTCFFHSSSTKPNVSSVAPQLAKKTGHGQSCSGSEPVTAKTFGVDIARKPGAQELIEDVATEGVSVPTTEMDFFAETPTEMVTTDSVSGNSPRVSPGWTAVGAGLNPGTKHQQHSEAEPSQPDVEPSQTCLELFPVRVSPGWTAVGAGLNPGTNHHQHSEGEPSQPDVEPSQACLELFPVRVEQMGLAAPGAGTSNITEVDLELSLGMPSLVLHL